jgi:hypothetical protein
MTLSLEDLHTLQDIRAKYDAAGNKLAWTVMSLAITVLLGCEKKYIDLGIKFLQRRMQ